ncbi:MAG: hypothetical protein QXT74_01300 [Candidatus Nezhaarchaeales archaeon]
MKRRDLALAIYAALNISWAYQASFALMDLLIATAPRLLLALGPLALAFMTVGLGFRRHEARLVWEASGLLAALWLLASPPLHQLSSVILLSFAMVFQLPAAISDFVNTTSFERRSLPSAIVGACAFLVTALTPTTIALPVLKGLTALLYVATARPEPWPGLGRAAEDYVKLKATAVAILAAVWSLFVIADSLSSVTLYFQLGEEKVASLKQLTLLVGVASMVPAGLLLDRYGRRPLAIFSYMLLGLGCALVSLSPSGPVLDVLYPVIDGFAWGALTILFTFVVWADISPPARRAKYIAIGLGAAILASWQGGVWRAYALPTPHITQLFSTAAVLLFLSGAMLYFVPETLPDHVRARRAMKEYIKYVKELSSRRLGRPRQ